ncbi:zinc finger protein 436 [Nasonia vitripennis]|uniref:C2H2-type domain-containing protein n=1 Tax=Nasonia vitripennis TaxID=7425 RepID=A0A7M7H940_NASVI|nr:zinc finger protein 436 [Nasonia vitripennis]
MYQKIEIKSLKMKIIFEVFLNKRTDSRCQVSIKFNLAKLSASALPKRIKIESTEEPVHNYDYSSSDIEFEEVAIDGSSFSTPTDRKNKLKASKSRDKKIVSSRKSLVYMCKSCNLILSDFDSLERHFGLFHLKKVKKPESVLTDCKTAHVTKLHRAPGESIVARWRTLATESIIEEDLSIKPDEELIISDDEEQVVAEEEVPIGSVVDNVSENLVEGDAEMVQEADRLLVDDDFDSDLIEEDDDDYLVEEDNEARLQYDSQSQVEFPCSYCDSVCPNKQAFRMHLIRDHTNCFEHQCKFCPQKFSIKEDLTRHVRFKHTHTPVNCNLCGKPFANGKWLYLHLKKLHNKPKYAKERIVCQKCGQSIPKCRFKAHMAKHPWTSAREKPYFCVVCNKTFGTRIQLRQHLIVKHSEKSPKNPSG